LLFPQAIEIVLVFFSLEIVEKNSKSVYFHFTYLFFEDERKDKSCTTQKIFRQIIWEQRQIEVSKESKNSLCSEIFI
jgi:hypothetical protein